MTKRIKGEKEFWGKFGMDSADEILKKLQLKGIKKDKISLRINERTALHELYYKKPTIH